MAGARQIEPNELQPSAERTFQTLPTQHEATHRLPAVATESRPRRTVLRRQFPSIGSRYTLLTREPLFMTEKSTCCIGPRTIPGRWKNGQEFSDQRSTKQRGFDRRKVERRLHDGILPPLRSSKCPSLDLPGMRGTMVGALKEGTSWRMLNEYQ